MKKLVVLALSMVFFTGAAFAAKSVNLKAGFDTFGNLGLKQDNNEASALVDTAFSVAIEGLSKVVEGMDNLKVGVGLEYQFFRQINENNDFGYAGMKYRFIPIYLTAQYSPSENYPIYVKGNLGYSLILDVPQRDRAETNGGLYLGAGVGYECKYGFIVELMYGMYSGSIKALGETKAMDLSYSKLGINFGYKFDI
ncbi:MAG: outer membrane beta-barrel protein [Endomicrobia bacterium]|nr:outer membrane beta-barrel protein [Endomicrobiia bacterium]MCL2507481.1 outer membrane beta-barrel protein [Endomicrobiia bacterium]